MLSEHFLSPLQVLGRRLMDGTGSLCFPHGSPLSRVVASPHSDTLASGTRTGAGCGRLSRWPPIRPFTSPSPPGAGTRPHRFPRTVRRFELEAASVYSTGISVQKNCQGSAQKGGSRGIKPKREVDLSFRQSLPGWFVERDLAAGIARVRVAGTLETSRNFVYPEKTAPRNSILPVNNNTFLLK